MNTPLLPMFADVFDHIPAGFGSALFFSVTGLLTVFVLALAARKGYIDNFGRKPAVDDQFASHSSVLDDLKTSLSGLAPKEKVDELINRLATFATREEFLAIEIIIQSFITRGEMEERFSTFQKQINLTVTEWKEGLHELRAATEAIKTGQESRTALLHTLDERSKHNNEKVESLSRQFDRLDTKIDRIIDRLPAQIARKMEGI